jgi:hypothetical protein
MKKEYPILYSTLMVQAKLAGRKTMTRRMTGLAEINKNPDKWRPYSSIGRYANGTPVMPFRSTEELELKMIKAPYGDVGDVMWTRESYAPVNGGESYLYKADFTESDLKLCDWKWKPSIHMPRPACRLRDEVVSVRLERLHDITEEDAIREGIEMTEGRYRDYRFEEDIDGWGCDPIESFRSLWIKINGKQSWDFNPWVWVYEYKNIEKP